MPLGWHFASWALGHLLGLAARGSLPTRVRTGRTAHVFTAQGGTRRENEPSSKTPLLGVSQKGSRERCLPVFCFAENETEKKRKKTEKNGRKRKESKEDNGKKARKTTDRKQGKNGKKGRERKKWKKTEKMEKIGSDTVPATPFAKPRFAKKTSLFPMPAHWQVSSFVTSTGKCMQVTSQA